MKNDQQPSGPRPRTAKPIISFQTAQALVDKYGSPLHVVSRQKLTDIYRTFTTNLPEGTQIHYAVKANRCAPILAHLNQIGCQVDVCSPDEIAACAMANFEPREMLHTHPCKTFDNMIQSYGQGVRWFTYDTLDELAKMSKWVGGSRLMLRVAVRSDAQIDLSKKFGCNQADVMELLEASRGMSSRVVGLSFHIGSQCVDPNDFGPVLKKIRPLWDKAQKAGFDLKYLDIGGGFPAPFREYPTVPSLGGYVQTVRKHLETTFGDAMPTIIVEPGRAMVAEAVTAIVRVIGKSIRGGKPWFFLDDGKYGTFSDVCGADLYDLLAEDHDRRPAKSCVLAGPTCDSMDLIDQKRAMPDLRVGELLLVPAVGAYTLVSASTFNGLPIPRMVGIDADFEMEMN